jgi:hypothetical protein
MSDMKSKAAKGKSAAGSGKRGIRDIAKGAAPKGPGKDRRYKPGDMFRSGRIVQPSVAPGKSKPKTNGAAAKAVAAGRAKAASRAKTNAAGRGKSASQDLNKRPVKALYKNK